MANSLNQPLAGSIEPVARTWGKADPALRRAFYEQAGRLAIREKRAELARAIGKTGRRMKPRKRPRPDGAEGPVMTPHDAASRTDRLLATRATERSLTLFWHAGINRETKTPWGTILAYHAEGRVKGAPVRDVRLSTRGITKIKKELAAWWTATLRARARDRLARERVEAGAAAARAAAARARPRPRPRPRARTVALPPVAVPRPVPVPMPTPTPTPTPTPPPPPRPAAVPAARTRPAPVPKPPPSLIPEARAIARASGVDTVLGARAYLLGIGWTENQANNCPAFYRPRERRIYLNEHHISWHDGGALARVAEADRWQSSGVPQHTIVHEVGHALHHRAIGDDRFAALGSDLDDRSRALVREQVSAYGATSRQEAVAEIYAGLKAGKVYDERVMLLYRSLGGPPV